VQRLTSSKVHLTVVSGDPATTLNHHKHNITSATQWTVGAAWRHCKLGDLRNVVREDGATENTLRARSAVSTTVTRTEAANVHALPQCAAAHTKGLSATIRWANGCLNTVGNLASRAQEFDMLRLSGEEWREALRDGVT